MFRQEALERLSTPERLDELMHVTSPRSWIALAALGGLIVAALIWSGFTNISTTVSGSGVVAGGSGSGADAIVYVKPADSISIRPGMDARLAEINLQSGRPSSVDGKVASIALIPASQSSMLRTLGSAGLVQLLVTSGQVIPIHVRLASSPHQAPSTGREQIRLTQATITTSQKRVISMLIP